MHHYTKEDVNDRKVFVFRFKDSNLGLYRVRQAPLREPLDIAVHAANCAKADFQSLKIGIVFWADIPDTVCSVPKVEIIPTR
ncbi:Cytochrome P450 monooxygenase FCK2 [Fusarium oxysporum f. sp. albedinis]|nr:Cytochrome P450 monooxygenase FCK2 [Fusarium oxysporum f. sp. albedinis]